eukprot:12898113-Prorocentrum_lima.AAC.1
MATPGLNMVLDTHCRYFGHRTRQWSDVLFESYIYDGGMHHRNECTILAASGTPQSALKLIPQIIDTCRVCRQFKQPVPSSGATSSLTASLNHL